MRTPVRRGLIAGLLLLVVSLMTPGLAGASGGSAKAGKNQGASRWADARGGVAPTRFVKPHPRAAGRTGASPFAPTDPSSLVNDPTADATAQDTQSETAIALGSGTNVIAAFNDSGSYNGSNNHFTGWSSSSDSGATWIDHGALPASSLGDAGDPVLARSASTGTVFLSTLGFTSQTNVQVFRSSDNGSSFAAPVGAFTGLVGADLDKDWTAVDNNAGTGFGNVYVVVRDFGTSNSILLTKSVTDGASWGPSGGVFIASGGAGNVQGPLVTVGPDHSVYVFWYDATGVNTLKVRKSIDFGATFGAPVTITTLLTSGINGDLGLGGGFRSNAFPQVAVNQVTGALYVVYNDSVAGDKSNVYLRQSTTGGSSWSAPILVNDDGGFNDQWSPSVAATPNGSKLIVSWYDRRNDPSDSRIQRFVRTASLKSGTPVFGKEFAVSPSFPVAIGQDPVVNSVYMGDYDMAAADNSGFYIPWGDNRDSDGAHAHQPDVRFGKVPLKPAAANLSITQTASASTVNIGDPVTFTLTVHNLGTKTASWVNVADPITGPMSVTSVSTTAGACGDTTSSCVMSSLAAGATATITVNGTANGPGKIKSVAKVSHAGKDSNSANNTAKKTVTVKGHVYFTDADCSIPDNFPAGVDCPLTVPDAGTVSFVSVSFRIAHTFDGDLQISVVAPDSTSVLLVNRRGGGGHDFGVGPNPCAGGGTVYTTLADGAGLPIGSGTAPFTGTFSPESPLSALAGHARAGTWKLHVADLAAIDVGSVLCWQVATN